ncbi:hypothetical protein [Cellulomonas sp. RIT-PI-Y]|uniref:hypothetical protein n=1 Tax=Cellulomonas sp. RIT-PI-Y TaxID=3035297 RepID=UPI0021DA4B91|nr:hypothetical protein [Cellulomonas sp. RIT-PI-Y]
MGLFDRIKGAASNAQQASRNADADVAAARAASGAPNVPGVAGMSAAEQQALIAQAMAQPVPTQAEADFRNTGGSADEAAFAPAANGVTWQQYATVIAQSQAVGYDPAALAGLAAGLGISGADWTAATEEFAARAQTNPAVGREMGRIAREGRA